MRYLTTLLIVALLFIAGCGSSDGLPTAVGEYVVKSKSVSFDGERYIFQWAHPTKGSDLTWAKTREVRLRLDDRTFLEVEGGKKAVLHLTQDEPVSVVRSEQGQQYQSAWYPYYYQPGTTIIVERERQPVYVYPPTSSFNNGETLTGGVRSDKPADAGQIKTLQAASNTVSGQSGGTGGGSAVTSKTGSSAPAAVATAAPSSGQSGGATSVPSINTSGGSSGAKPAPTSAPSSSQPKPPSISTKK